MPPRASRRPAASAVPVVSVVRGSPGERPETLLAQAVAAPALSAAIGPPNAAARAAGALVVVAVSPPAPVAPAVAHELVDLLHESGWERVDVGAALTAFDRDRGYADLGSVVRDLGLLGTTRRGNRYDVLDLREDVEPADVPAASVLHGCPVARAWQRAGLRILLSRNVTDPFDGYALGLDLLLRVAPPVPGAAPGDVAADLHRYLPAGLSVVDATTSSHGEAGDITLAPITTDTVIAGTDGLLVDLTGAQLQGVDPAASRLVSAAQAQDPLPTDVQVEGDLTPYRGWKPAHPLLLSMAQEVGESPGLARILGLLMSGGPMPDPVVRALGSALGPVLSDRTDPTRRAWVAGAGYTAAGLVSFVRAWQTVLAKDSVERVVKPLGFDPAAYSARDFDDLPAMVEGFTRLLDGVEPVDDGLRWRTVDRATVFEISRLVPARFDDWVARVDVSRGISLMADYVGGRLVVLTRDREGRPARQAERNVYLPQPNYLALWGGRPIDVAKIELVEHQDDRVRLLWRTVRSPNDSATYDDGSLTFAAEGDQTRLTVTGRQLFALPPYWEAVDLARFPEVRDPLVEDAYRRFFTLTFDNLEACFEGREFRVGREPSDPDGPLPTALLAMGLDLAKGWLADRGGLSGASDEIWARATGRSTRGSSSPAGGRLDADGFRHFPGTGTA